MQATAISCSISPYRSQGQMIGGGILVFFGLLLAVPIAIWARDLFLILGSIGLLFVAAGAWTLWSWRRERRHAAQANADGVIVDQNGKRFTAKWDDLREVYQQIVDVHRNGRYTHTVYRFTLVHRDGAKVHLDERLGGVADLGKFIQQEVTTRRLPEAIRHFEQGAPLKFGALTISRDGISNGKVILPWSRHLATRLYYGDIYVKQRAEPEDFAKVGAHTIPNLYVLLNLMAQITPTS